MSARLVPLNFTQSANYLDVKGISDSTVAPAGHYMMIAVDDKGVPSVAKIVKIDNYLSVNVVSVATGAALAQKDSALVNGSAVGTAAKALNALGQAWQMQHAEWSNGAYRSKSMKPPNFKPKRKCVKCCCSVPCSSAARWKLDWTKTNAFKVKFKLHASWCWPMLTANAWQTQAKWLT